jgi:hypothetical protein
MFKIMSVMIGHRDRSTGWPRHPEPLHKILESGFVPELAEGWVETQIEEVVGALLVGGLQALEGLLALAE